MKIVYEANMGFFIETNHKMLSIDLLCNPEGYPYLPTNAETLEAVTTAKAPFADMDCMLHTHWHPDHFDASHIESYLRAGGKAKILLPRQTADLINKSYVSRFQEQFILLDDNMDGKRVYEDQDLTISAYGFSHEGKDSEDVDTWGYLIQLEGKTIFHVGDARIQDKNYEKWGFNAMDLDLLIVPFPYIARKDGVTLIKKHLDAKKIIVSHLPPEEKDEFAWRAITIRRAGREKEKFDEIAVLTDYHQSMEL